MANPPTEITAFFAKYRAPVPTIAAALRRLILQVLPVPQETLDTSAKLVGYGFGPRYCDMVCTIIPSRTAVKLGLAYGASLADPDGLLGGEGKIHRHIDFRAVDDVNRAGVRQLLAAALAAQRSRAAG